MIRDPIMINVCARGRGINPARPGQNRSAQILHAASRALHRSGVGMMGGARCTSCSGGCLWRARADLPVPGSSGTHSRPIARAQLVLGAQWRHGDHDSGRVLEAHLALLEPLGRGGATRRARTGARRLCSQTVHNICGPGWQGGGARHLTAQEHHAHLAQPLDLEDRFCDPSCSWWCARPCAPISALPTSAARSSWS